MSVSQPKRTGSRRDEEGRNAIWLRALGWLYRRLGWKGRLILAAVVVLAIAASLWSDRRWPWQDEPTQPSYAGTSGVVGLFVLPDDGNEPILTEMDAARTSITLQIYLLTDEEIFAALGAAADRGVRVRVLLEEDPFGGPGTEDETFARLARRGVDVRWGDPEFRFSHVKTFVVDEHVAIIMNQNLTTTAFAQNREFFAITTQEALVTQAAAIFEADWNRTGEEIDGPLIVSPTNSRTILLDLIDGATRTLDLYAEVVRDSEVLAALIDAEDRGVAVRLIVSPDSEDDDHGRFERGLLRQAGGEVHLARGLYIHAKMILADQSLLYVGSQNLTATSLDDNREIGVLIDDPHAIARVSDVFDSDLAKATPEEIAVATRQAASLAGVQSAHRPRARAAPSSRTRPPRRTVIVLAERDLWREVVTLVTNGPSEHFRQTET